MTDRPQQPRGPRDVDDAVLLARLGEVLNRVDPPPPWLVDLAKLSYDLRSVDAELAELVADSATDGALAGVRAATVAEARMLTFEHGDWVLEVEASRHGPTWRLIGQVVPPAVCRIQVVQRAARHELESDDLGRFEVADLAGEPVQLLVDSPGHPRVSTGWFTLD